MTRWYRLLQLLPLVSSDIPVFQAAVSLSAKALRPSLLMTEPRTFQMVHPGLQNGNCQRSAPGTSMTRTR